MGCKVDLASQIARIPESVLTPIIEAHRAAPAQHHRTVDERGLSSYEANFFNSATHLLDWHAGQRRLGTVSDATDMIRLSDATPEVPIASSPVALSDVRPGVESVYQQVLLLRNARNPAAVYFRDAGLIPYFEELGRIMKDDDGALMSGMHFVKAPLTITRTTCEFVRTNSRYNLHFDCGTRTTAGSTAPVTAAGTIALATAEILAGWVAARSIVPGIGLYGMCCTGVIDVPSGDTTFSSPESVLQDAAIVELFDKRLGGRTRAIGRAYIGAKVPGIQAACERAFKTIALGAASGWFVSSGVGILDNGLLFCPAQAMLDIDFGKMLHHFNRGVEISDDMIGMDAIRDAVLDGPQPFLNSQHTAQHFSQSLWFPELFSRSPLIDAKADSDRLLIAAEAKWRETLRSHVPVELDADKDAALSKVLERAEALL